MNKQQLGNSHSQPAPRIGNMYGRRLNAGPASLGSGTARSGSQPNAPDSSPSTILSRQSSRGNPSPTTIELTPRVGNLNGRRRNVRPGAMGSGTSDAATQRNEPASSPRAQSGSQASRRDHSPPPIASGALRRPPKRPRRSTIRPTAYAQHETDLRGQGQTEIDLSDDSDEYQNSRASDEAESDTEPDPEEIDIVDSTASRRIPGSQAMRKQQNNGATKVRISTSSGSQLPGPAWRTSAHHGRIIRGTPYSSSACPSSSGTRCSSPPASLGATTSDIRSSSPARHMGTPQQESWGGSSTRRNMESGPTRAIVECGKALTTRYTLFEDPLPNGVVLIGEVHSIWDEAVVRVVDSEYIAPTDGCLKVVSGLK